MSATNPLWTNVNAITLKDNLIEQIVNRSNINKACKRVITNGGSPGIDGMEVKQLGIWLQRNMSKLQNSLLAGTYIPQPVRLVEIEKPGGGIRMLGVPTVVDRMIQQAIHQVMNPYFDLDFSDSSFGFRSGRSAIQAVQKVQEYQRSGHRWVVNVDLRSFFDVVNHDILMSLIKKKISDKRLLKLLNQYLQVGIMQGGIVSPRTAGTPQGSPLSPLLSNILLNELDKELENRGHKFCRYADDFVILVKSQKSAERVMGSICGLIEKRLKLQINHSKSQVCSGWQLEYLGFGFTKDRNVKLSVPGKMQQRFKAKARTLFRMGRGMNLLRFIHEKLNPMLRGWINYYSHSNVKSFAEKLDGWVRRHLRLIIWRQWKIPRTRFKRFYAMGMTFDHAMQCAYNKRGPWWNSGAQHMQFSFPRKYFVSLGLVSMLELIVRK
jgi:RNA-directed DNA polymerase